MAISFLRHCAVATALAGALSLASVSAGSAAPRWGAGAAIGAGIAGFAVGAAAAGAAPYYGYDGYYDYAPGPYYYDYGTTAPYYIVRPAFPPGCGAGRPHC